MTAVELVRRTEWTGGDIITAPDVAFLPASRHAHRVPGVWDDDNGAAAGKVCAICWQANRPIALGALLAARWAAERAAEAIA